MRRRIVEVNPSEQARGYVSDDDDKTANVRALHDRTLEHVADRIGVTSERTRQIEVIALEKVKIGLDLEARLVPNFAGPVLASLKGQPLDAFREALATAARRER